MINRVKNETEEVVGVTRCPGCKSEEVEGAFLDVRGGQVFQQMYCHSCDKEWEAVFIFDRVEVV